MKRIYMSFHVQHLAGYDGDGDSNMPRNFILATVKSSGAFHCQNDAPTIRPRLPLVKLLIQHHLVFACLFPTTSRPFNQ
jgi:hypothetical protein